MGGLTRRELLARSAVAGGVVWAAPVLSTGRAWGQTSDPCCACDGGELIYAKFAPGNSQTCVNQCLQPGAIARFEFDCLVDAGLIGNCDDVNSNDDTASIAFGSGVTPIKFAIKSQDNCYVSRCNEGFSVVYLWSTSFNDEKYDVPACNATASNQPCIFDDPASDPDDALFQVYTGGTGPASTRCTGQQTDFRPMGTRCGHTLGVACPCATPISGVFMTTVGINDKLNFIEMELCITQLSKINCVPLDC